MSNSPSPSPTDAAGLEQALRAVELHLSDLGQALGQADASRIDTQAADLQRALAAAVDVFSRAARAGQVPESLRHRLALAGGQVAAQREALARAMASLDRAVEVLLPDRAPGTLYSSLGGAERRATSGAARA